MAPLILWRLVKQKHVATAFSGEGAAWFGGRWNPIGLPVVYLSETLSLAALEFLVHLTLEDRRLLFAAISVEVPEGVAFETLEPAALPTNWRDESVPEETQKIGADWAAKKQSVLLDIIGNYYYSMLLNYKDKQGQGYAFLRRSEAKA
jgi:RES domain-containing protein